MVGRFLFILAFLVCFIIGDANAQNAPQPLAPAGSVQANELRDITSSTFDYPLYRLTPDKIEIIKLPEAASSTVIGNQQHLDIFFDTSDRAVLVPRLPGASHFQILNQRGQVIAEGHTIIASPSDDYVRVRRSCAGSSDACRDMSVYFCPGMCHDVLLPEQGLTTTIEDAEVAND